MRSCAKLSAPARPRYTRTYLRPARITPAQHARIRAHVFARVCPCVPECLRVFVRELYLPSRALMTRIYHAHIPPPAISSGRRACDSPSMCAGTNADARAYVQISVRVGPCVIPKSGRKKSARCGRSLVGYSVPPSSAVVLC